MTNKRLLKELLRLTTEQNNKEFLDNDYLVYFDESNYNKVETIIKGPIDSVYRHKFIKLNFDIPSDYPHSPPKVSFVNYDYVRIHPNMYQDGKCCSTILNTWPSDNEKWTSSMGIETILLAFLSFLDNNPYTYEPGGRDDTSYTEYVSYQTWKTCLLRYTNIQQPDIFTKFINNYLLVFIDDIFEELTEYSCMEPYGSKYTSCFEIENYIVDYELIITLLENHYNYIDYKENYESEGEDLNYQDFLNINVDYKCNICFDSYICDKMIELNCKHSFHTKCISSHMKNNGNICALCRGSISDDIKKVIFEEKFTDSNWVINPETNRKVKIGGKTYQRLVLDGII